MTKYVRFTFQNIEPVEVADDHTAQSGQANTLCYIPGTTLRGALIQELIREGIFEENKTLLLSDRVAFLNAYPAEDGHDLMPSIKGFYEDKTETGDGAKQIENMLATGEITPGNKRASLGKYCYVEDGCVYYTDMELGSDMKINKGKGESERTVFRNQYIVPGYQFTGTIAVHDSDELADLLTSAIEKLQKNGNLVLGGSRSFGYGRCRLLSVSADERLPYEEYAPKTEVKDQVYMVLLSNTSMVNACGETVGIDTELLRERLGLPALRIAYCSTSMVDVRGYNRTWGIAVPSVKMYEAGSVFRLVFEGYSVSAETLKQVMNDGIGVKNNEGYGRVLFFDKFETVSAKKKMAKAACGPEADGELDADELATLKIAAAGYYHKLIDRAQNAYLADEKNSLKRFGLNGSQLGMIESIISLNLYAGEKCFEKLSGYLKQANQKDARKRVQKGGARRSGITEYLETLRSSSLSAIFPGLPETVMGLPVSEFLSLDEADQIRLELVIAQVKCLNREGAGNE
ncbi:MAG: hypothetical protein LUI87_17005 [Lachnospiraceae bacterium]|nr:hypothetical protein [Lachnospiraceae bacterium]